MFAKNNCVINSRYALPSRQIRFVKNNPMPQIFQYDQSHTDYLASRCPNMAMAIDKIGHISRQINPDTFSELIRAIIAQQISGIAAQTIWQRLTDLTSITPTALTQLSADDLQGIGVSYRKAGYIQAIAWDILDNQLDLDELHTMGDDEIKQMLTAFKGVGEWTAQMLMIFSLNRMNVLSYHDLAILRGLRMLYRHRKISPQLFAKYQRRFAPYNSVASLYLWEIAGGALDLTDPKPKSKSTPKPLKAQ